MSSLTLTDAYKFYTSQGGKLSYKTFREICIEFNQQAVESLLEGRRIEMGSFMGFLQIVQIPRNFNKPRVGTNL